MYHRYKWQWNRFDSVKLVFDLHEEHNNNNKEILVTDHNNQIQVMKNCLISKNSNYVTGSKSLVDVNLISKTAWLLAGLLGYKY